MSKYKLIFTKLEMCIYVVEIWFEITHGQIPSIFDRVHIIVQGIIVSCFYCQITTILIFEFLTVLSIPAILLLLLYSFHYYT